MNRFWIIGGALVATLASVGLAFWLGSAGFDVRRYRLHHDRLAKVLREQPSADRLTRGLEAEGTPLLLLAVSAAEKERVAAERGGDRLGEIRDKAGRYPELRLYRASDMLYFVYFDSEGKMRDFTCVSR